MGWSMSNTLHATIATDALMMAVKRRSPPIALVHHSDRGVQYACHACRELLKEHGMAQSMSRAGNWYDNANDRKPLGDPEEGTRPRLTRLRQPRSVRGDREGRIGFS